MLDTLANDSDSAIVVRKADAQRDGIKTEDNQLYDMLANALGNSGLEYWLFYVVNSCAALNNMKTGEILLEEFMKPLDISAYKLAQSIHVPVSRIQDIIHNRRKITADTSLRLSRFFGVSDRYFLDIQNDIDMRNLKSNMSDDIAHIQLYQAV